MIQWRKQNSAVKSFSNIGQVFVSVDNGIFDGHWSLACIEFWRKLGYVVLSFYHSWLSHNLFTTTIEYQKLIPPSKYYSITPSSSNSFQQHVVISSSQCLSSSKRRIVRRSFGLSYGGVLYSTERHISSSGRSRVFSLVSTNNTNNNNECYCDVMWLEYTIG